MKFCRIKSIIIVACVLFLGSCSTPKKIVYFQDMPLDENGLAATAPEDIRIMPKDKISIMVNCQDARLDNLFNLPVVNQQFGQSASSSSSSSSGSNRGLSGYTVDRDGNIDFPVLGSLHIAGMTREQLAAFIKNELISRNLAKTPIVTVDYMNLTISVLGEVNSQGRYSIDKDNVTILDAISQAGDLTIYGKRDGVTVLRNVDGKQKSYKVDLCSAADLYSSPAYYLQQNDVVYVEPNETRVRQSTVNGNTVRSTSFWLSAASFLMSIIVLIAK